MEVLGIPQNYLKITERYLFKNLKDLPLEIYPDTPKDKDLKFIKCVAI